MQSIEPVLDYIYGKEVIANTGVVTTSEISDTRQTYEVIAVGPGRYDNGVLIKQSCKVGDKVIIQKHAAEGDTPTKMLGNGYALFQGSRVMAVII